MEPVFIDIGISGLWAFNIREKRGSYTKSSFWTSFSLLSLPEKYLQCCFWKRKLHYVISPMFLKFLLQLLQSTLMKRSMTEFGSVLGCLVSFAFFVFMFWFFFLLFFLLVCFLKLKIYILIYIQLCGWVSNKKFSPGRFPETRLFVYWLNPNKFNCIQIFTNNWLKTELIMNKKILDMKVCCYLWSTEKFQTSLLEVASVHFNKKYRSWS